MHTFTHTHTSEMSYGRKPVHLVALIIHWLGNYRRGALVLPMGRVGSVIQRKASSKGMPVWAPVAREGCWHDLEWWGPLGACACAWHKLLKQSLSKSRLPVMWPPRITLCRCCQALQRYIPNISPDSTLQAPALQLWRRKVFYISCHFGVCVIGILTCIPRLAVIFSDFLDSYRKLRSLLWSARCGPSSIFILGCLGFAYWFLVDFIYSGFKPFASNMYGKYPWFCLPSLLCPVNRRS